MDVSKEHVPDLIANCVTTHGGVLHAPVNNAGISSVMPLEHSDGDRASGYRGQPVRSLPDHQGPASRTAFLS